MSLLGNVRHPFPEVGTIVILNRGLSFGTWIASFHQTPEPMKTKSNLEDVGGREEYEKNTSSTPSIVFTAQVNVIPPTATKLVAIRKALAANKAVDWFI